MFDLTEDTIAAISSAVASSPRGIVRISGPDALSIADRLFRSESGRPLRDSAGFRRTFGYARLEPDGAEVPAEAYVFRAPRSYTRQDLVELHAPGSPVLLSMLLEHVIGLGARQAEPGEFTARAFFAGAMSLTQVEGVAAVVHARSDAQLAAAQQLLQGVLSERAGALQDRLADLLALVEADIDFAEEAIEFLAPVELLERLDELRDSIDRLMRSSISAERLQTLPRVALAGPPNAGKSTLLNRLSGLDRAICSPLPGTTRDVLTAPMRMPHAEALLIDAAGLQPTGGPIGDEITLRADEAARRAIASAELVCFVIDLASEPVERQLRLLEDLPAKPLLLVANKVDLLGPEHIERRCRFVRSRAARLLAGQAGRAGPVNQASPVRPSDQGKGPRLCAISAKTGWGCQDLRQAIEACLHLEATDRSGELVVLNARHRQALQEAAQALERARTIAAETPRPLERAELIALELREACDHLAAITGAVTTEELLGRIFRRFCIGK